MAKTVSFIIDVATTYNALLSHDWIYTSRCIPSSVHQYLIMGHNNDSTDVVKIDVMLFVLNSNTVDTLLYTEDNGSITFHNRDDEGYHTNYAMT